jgi:hypothetical protein
MIRTAKEVAMSQTYKLIEIVGTSEKSFAEAARNGVKEASRSLHDMAWFEVVEERGRIENGEVKEFQVKMKVAFKLVR